MGGRTREYDSPVTAEKARITLISPYPDFRAYGIRSLSTFLRRRGIAVSTIYLMHSYSTPYPGAVLDQLMPLLEGSDLVGISVMSNYFMNCAQLTGEIKKRFSFPVVWGGVHATVAPEECLDHCDIAVRGEGEETLRELISAVKSGGKISGIRGTVIRRDGKIVSNELRPLLAEEDLPVVDNDFSSDYVLRPEGKIASIDSKTLKRFVTRDYMTLTSFGCPFSCSYCINNKLNKIYGRRVRFRKIDDVIGELAAARQRMPFIRHVTFDDDAFIQRNIEELKEFAAKYRERIKLPFFVSGVNPLLVREEKIRILVEAGMNRIKMGIQSGSETAKLIYHRRVSNERIIASARIINKFRKRLTLTGYDLILDNPFESKRDVIQTINLLSRLPAPYTLNLTSLTFYPGTDIYEKGRQAGYVRDNVRDVYQKLYHGPANNYLNFIIVLFAICKIPAWILGILLNRKITDREIIIPPGIFRLFILIGFARRGVDFLVKGDPHTFFRLVRYNPLAP